MKERKGNKSKKVVKPVKKSVALFLTIVTVFAFAAACFSLGFCSGKKIERAEAVPGNFVFYYLIEEPDVSVNLTYSGTFNWGGSLFLGFSIADNELRATTLSSYKVIYSAADGWNTTDTAFNSTLMKYMYFQFTAPTGEVALWLNANSVKNAFVPFLMAGSYTFKDSWLSNNESYNSSFIFTANEETYQDFYIIYDSSNGISIKYDNTIAFSPDSGWGTGYQTIKIPEDSAVNSFDFYRNFLTSTATYSSSLEPIAYTLTIQFKGEGFTHTATPTGTSEKISDDVFECDESSGAYVAIGPQDDYIIEEILYNVDSGTATIQESGVNGYRVLRNSGNAVVTFTVTTKTDAVVIPSGYYWLKSLPSHPSFSTRYTIAVGDFQAIKSIENGSIVWENLTAFVPYNEISPYFYFASAPSVGLQVFAPGSYRIVSVPSGVSNPYPSPVALYYPVIYVPEDIKDSSGYSDTLVSFMTGGSYTYKSDIGYYNAFYVELPSNQASIPVSLGALSGLTIYTPSQNVLISPQSVSLRNLGNVSSGDWTLYYTVDFAGRPAYGEYTGAWFGIEGGQKRSVYNQTEPFYADGSIYINSTVMPTFIYSFLNSAFNVSAVPIDVDPPSADYWLGLDMVLSYQVFGIPLSALLAVVVSSVFVVIIIRLFAGG